MAFTSFGRSKVTCSIEYCIFLHRRNVAILAHALTKEDTIPPADIERALKRKREFENDPEGHTYAED